MIHSIWLPYLVVFVVMLAIHKNATLKNDDINHYVAVPLDDGFLSYLVFRYNNWSGRLLVECVVVLMNKLGMTVWKIINAGVITSIVWSLNSIFNKEKMTNITWIVCLVVMTFPFVTMGSAGWIATSVGYSWTLAAGLASAVPLSKSINKEDLSVVSIVAGTTLMVFATDAEQIATIALVALFAYFIEEVIIRKKKLCSYAKVLLFVTVLKFLFILTAPGNSARMSEEVGKWFPNYLEISFIQKIYIGFMYTARVLLGYPFILITTFILLSIYSFVLEREIWIKVLSITSTSLTLLLTVGQSWLSPAMEKIQWIRKIINTNESGGRIDYSVIAILVICFLAASLAVLIFKNFGERCWIFIGLLALGVMSQMMMAFSPTVYASSYRTGIFMYFCFIIFNLLCTKGIIRQNQDYYHIHIYSMLIILSSLNLLNHYGMT